MRIIGKTGKKNIAIVYLAEMRKGKFVEFVESVQPPVPKEEKWVIIVSTLFGCPVECTMCDAGGGYSGRLSKEEILSQIDYLVIKYFPDRRIPVNKFKIQFARMGEPSFNPSVLEVLKELPEKYCAPGIIPCLSSIAPKGSDDFFYELLQIKQKFYLNGRFQLQFSIHTTDMDLRDQLIPVEKWSFSKISRYGKKFYFPGGRKITLNFALAENSTVSPDILINYFDPEIFLIKLTPINPTMSVLKNNIRNAIHDEVQANNLEVVRLLRNRGYEVIVSIGELEENKIGSNCGQYLKRFLDGDMSLKEESYTYKMQREKV